MDDWHIGKDLLMYTLMRKLSDLTKLPLKLAGLAHPEEDIARHIARECVLEYAEGGATAVSDAPIHHRLTLKFLAAESPI